MKLGQTSLVLSMMLSVCTETRDFFLVTGTGFMFSAVFFAFKAK